MPRAIRRAPAFWLLLLFIAAAAPAFADGASPSNSTAGNPAGAPGATLSGSIVSSGGAGLSGARLTLIRKETGWSLTAASGEHGLYRAAGLDAGDYSVTVELAGFAPSGREVVLRSGESRTLNFVLSPTGLQERIRVTAASPSDSLEASDLRRSAARDVGEALAALPGMWSLRKGGIANDVVVRGLPGQDVTLLIDGERLYGACPNHMDPPAFHVDFAEVDRIDTGKGPFDVRNAGSLGGTVSVVTRPPEPGLHATPFLAVGPWGYLNPSATLSFAGEKLSVLGGASYRESEPYRDGSGARFTENAGYEPREKSSDAYRVGTFWTNLAVHPSKADALRLSYTRQEADHVDYPYLLMDAIYDDTDRARIAYDRTPKEGSPRGLQAEAYFTRVHHWMTDEYRLSSAGKPREYSMGTLATAQTAGGRVEGRTDRTMVGLEAFQRLWDASTMMAAGAYAPQRSLPGTRVELAGLYAETEQPLSRRWKITAGARLDRARSSTARDPAALDLYEAYNDTRDTSRTDTVPSAFVRLVLRTDSLKLSAGAGSTSKIPEPSERYFALRRMGTDWVGNPGLRPVRNTGLDLTLTAWRTGLHVSGSLFASRLRDNITVCNRSLVNPVPGVMNTAARSYANTEATLWGAEMSAVATLAARLFLSGDASFVQGSQQPAPDKGILSENLAEIPPQRFRAALRYDTGSWWTEMEGVVSGAQGRVDADLLEEPTPGWAVANLRAGVQRGSLTFTAGVTNLFDRTYHQHLSYQRDPFRSGTVVNEPGRGWFLNAGYRF